MTKFPKSVFDASSIWPHPAIQLPHDFDANLWFWRGGLERTRLTDYLFKYRRNSDFIATLVIPYNEDNPREVGRTLRSLFDDFMVSLGPSVRFDRVDAFLHPETYRSMLRSRFVHEYTSGRVAHQDVVQVYFPFPVNSWRTTEVTEGMIQVRILVDLR